MPKVNVLPREISELIAAGEVIERPASIVKELLENAVDAGAKAVTVEIQNGGTAYIRVTDDGCGMDAEDAVNAFLRHATSKVRLASDLTGIATLGFRGEALASIAAVSHVELMTRTEDSYIGAFVRYSASCLEESREVGCPVGTTIVIRDIFYNVPARLKFLKSDLAEGNAVASIIEKLAISHPEIAFKFIRDNKSVFSTPGDGKLLTAVYTVFGKVFSSAMTPVNYSLSGVTVEGYVGKPSFSRGNRGMQVFYVNGRYAQSRTCMAALEQAFKGSLMTGRYPCCVLNIGLPHDMVDVNVHPAKIEVRFVSEKAVFDGVYFAVKSALAALNPAIRQKSDLTVLSPFDEGEKGEQPSLTSASRTSFLKTADSEEKEEQPVSEQPSAAEKPTLFQLYAGFSEKAASSHRENVDIDAAPDERDFSSPASAAKEKSSPLGELLLKEAPLPFVGGIAMQKAPQSVSSARKEPEPFGALPKAPQPEPSAHSYRYLGEIFFTYLLAEVDGTLVIIDKHAAHEKILYNHLKKQNGSLEPQLLLTGAAVPLSKGEYQAVLTNLSVLEGLGFLAEDFGQNTVMLRAVPAICRDGDPGEMLSDIASSLALTGKAELPKRIDELLHRIACRAAMKANDKNSSQEMVSLIRQVWEDPEVRYCPHGRPVLLTYSKKEIEKLFGRLG